ncbi:MAG: helix-turn-helix domain-containing protein [Eubacterium sp.]|nr:helix-turn-helix domain-containing protein [Eubacterium sp.]
MKDKPVIRSPFGKKLVVLRNSMKISQKVVAETIGVKENTYRKYELNSTPRKKETLVKIATFYGVTVDYLLGKTDKKFGEDKQAITTYSEKEHDINYILRHPQEKIEVVENDLDKVSDFEVLFLKKLRGLSAEDRNDVVQYLCNKSDNNKPDDE